MDDSDDPVMALLATQRAVLVAVENLAGQVGAMQAKVDAMGETLAQLVAGSAGAAVAGGADRVMTLGDRFRAATAEEAARDPELRAAQGNYMVAQAIAKGLNKGDPDGAARDAARAREWIADQLDRGRVFEPGKVRSGENGTVAVVEPIHEEMFPGRVRVQRPNRER
ncbi:hypothetical protein [Rhizorhapis suberifaciens]|uniref:Uncharacterized protein n=1 Tax=Rhizorhapis suberifaciens TaxID=13656 RepID=A0A840HZX0_9SPHN|nr:hypothetical protein [Rhizorhapis suberifaciens]MBB4642956.1 hypothetical protein [Rhizorhapis suberifaciens]